MGARRGGFELGVGERAAVWLVARAEARRRRSGLLGVAAMVALVSGVVILAVTGAQRTATTVERFRAQAHASDVSYQPGVPAQTAPIASATAAQPEVERSTVRLLVNGWPDDPGIPDIAILSDPDGLWGDTIDHPRLVAGRFPAPTAVDEVLLGVSAAKLTGLEVGDTLPVHTWTSHDLEQLFAGAEFPGFNGPHLDLHVVGIGRFPDEFARDLSRGELTALASPGFIAAHPGIGVWPGVAVAQLRHGSRDVAAVSAGIERTIPAADLAASGGTLLPATARDRYLDDAQGAVDGLAVGLLVLAAGAAIAGAIAVGQAISRQMAMPDGAVTALAAMGSTPSGIAAASSLPAIGAGLVGAVVGAALATAASPLLPTGLARQAEVDPGVWVSPLVLGLGVVLVVGLVAWWSFQSARRSLARRPAGDTGAARQPPGVARAASRMRLPLSALVGVHLATDRGRGRAGVPVRSAVLAVAVGVAGLVGAGVLATSLHDLSTQPARWGWTWSTIPDYFGDGDVADLQDRLVGDPRLDGVATLTSSGLLLGGRVTTGYTMAAAKGDLSLIRQAGRLPDQPDEIALGEATMDDLGVAVGGTVDAKVPDGTTRTMHVVGQVLLPPVEERTIGLGAVVTADALEALSTDDPLQSVLVRYDPDLPADEVEAGLTADYGLQFTLFTRPIVPGPIRNLAESRYVAVTLAGYFVLLGAIALFHALLVSTRRRQPDLATLRALGVRPVQLRRSVGVESLLLCLEAVVIGVPAGLVIGRVVWRALVADLRAVADPAMPWLLLIAVVPVACAIALLVAWWPSRLVARGRPADRLRAE